MNRGTVDLDQDFYGTMDPEFHDSGEETPEYIVEAQAALRSGMERAHELVAEAKLAMRQMSDGNESPYSE